MGEKNEIEEKIKDYELEAARNVLDAFNEGYALGRQEAEKIYGGKDE